MVKTENQYKIINVKKGGPIVEKSENNSKERLMRLEESELRLRAIHEMRWMLLSRADEVSNHDIYVEGNEILNEVEQKVWQYINGEVEKI